MTEWASKTWWLWYVAGGDAHGRYWAISPAGSIGVEVMADEVHILAHARTRRAPSIGRGFLEVEGRLLIVRGLTTVEATILEPDDRPTLPPPTADERAASFPREPEIPV